VTIKTSHEIPSDLPAARIFLDDLEELEAIFAETETNRDVEEEARRVRYQIGNRICDSIDDLRLKKMGLRTSELSMASDLCSLDISELSSKFRCSFYVSEAERRLRYEKVLAVFQRRERKIKSAIYRSLVLVGALGALCWIVGVAALNVAFWIIWRHHVAGVLALCVVIAAYLFHRTMLSKHSSVEFRYAHEDVEGTFWKRPWVNSVLSALAGAVILAIMERVVKAYWP
jgi:hypothetical protein